MPTICYDEFQPQDKWEVLDDIDAAGTPEDFEVIRPYAEKFDVMDEFNEAYQVIQERRA